MVRTAFVCSGERAHGSQFRLAGVRIAYKERAPEQRKGLRSKPSSVLPPGFLINETRSSSLPKAQDFCGGDNQGVRTLG